jgi:uncharacterized protein with GYD domain
MPFYMLQGRYTAASIKALVQKPEDRSKAAAAVVKATGGKLHNYFMSLGEYDFVVISEFPDDEGATALAMAVGAAGTATDLRTTKLLTPDTAQKAMAAAATAGKSYSAPKGG